MLATYMSETGSDFKDKLPSSSLMPSELPMSTATIINSKCVHQQQLTMGSEKLDTVQVRDTSLVLLQFSKSVEVLDESIINLCIHLRAPIVAI